MSDGSHVGPDEVSAVNCHKVTSTQKFRRDFLSQTFSVVGMYFEYQRLSVLVLFKGLILRSMLKFIQFSNYFGAASSEPTVFLIYRFYEMNVTYQNGYHT